MAAAFTVALAATAPWPATASALARTTPAAVTAASKLVIAGPVTLKYTATTSDSDSCTGPCDETLALTADYSRYSRSATGTQAAVVTFTVEGGKAKPGHGVLGEPTDTYNASGAFTHSPSQCGFLAGSATEVAKAGTSAGTLLLASLKVISGRAGTNDLELDYNVNPAPQENTYWSGTTTPCQIAPYPFAESQSYTDNQIVSQSLGLYDPNGFCAGLFGCYIVKGWTISPHWKLDTGGKLATKTATGSAPQPPSEPGAGDTGPVKSTQTWTLTTQPCPAPYELSGPAWARRFPESRSLSDLATPFRGDVTRFIAAMTHAGIAERTLDTLRPPERAYLMHYSWLIAKKKIDPRNVPAFAPKRGQATVDICWVHASAPGVPDLAASVSAAQQMVRAFGIDPRLKVAPALNSLHTRGLAIDMATTWNGQDITILDADGHPVTIDTVPHDGANSQLIAVGATYGVIHLQPASNDPNHWSVNGH